MRIREIKNIESWDSYEQAWLNLHVLCNPSHPFLNWEWIRIWADRLQVDGISPLLLLVMNRENEIVGIAPFQIKGIGIFSCIEGFAQEFCDYVDWLYHPSYRIEVGEAVLDWLKQQRKNKDFIKINKILSDSLPYQIVNKINSSKLKQLGIAPHVLILGQFEVYLKSLKSKFVSDTKRRERKLLREIGKINYVVVDDKDEIKKILLMISKWHDQRMKEKKEKSYLNRINMIDHFEYLYKTLLSKGQLHLSGFKIDEHYIAINVGFIYENKLFSYTPVFDSRYSKYAILRLLKMRHIEECYKEGIEVYDFCLGGEEYKFKFNPVIKKLYSFSFYGFGIKGLVLKLYETKLKPFIKNNGTFIFLLRKIKGKK